MRSEPAQQFEIALPPRRTDELIAERQRDAKARAAVAFRAYSDAVATGDAEIAEAARKRFLEASAKLQRGRRS